MSELRNFDLNLLVAFDLLMQEQNVSRAAERMFVGQSAMSHILQRLRQQLDDPLLVKTPSGMKPMDRALALIDPVRAVRRNVKRLISAREDFDPAKSLRRFVSGDRLYGPLGDSRACRADRSIRAERRHSCQTDRSSLS